MLITIEGRKQKDRSITAGILAELTALVRSRKSLIVQLTNHSPECLSAESIMIGKKIKASSLKGDSSDFDSGIDSLLRETETQKLTIELLSECCEKLIKQTNLLDIAGASKKAGFETDIEENPETILTFIESTMKFYEYVFVILPENKNIKDMIQEKADYNIMCVPQNNRLYRAAEAKDIVMVMNYEAESIYHLGYMKRLYHAKNIFTMPHNVKLNDAIIDKNAFKFIALNYQNDKEDVNFELFESMKKAVDALFGKTSKKYEPEELEDDEPKGIEENLEDDEPVDIVENTKPVKRGLFAKREKKVKPPKAAKKVKAVAEPEKEEVEEKPAEETETMVIPEIISSEESNPGEKKKHSLFTHHANVSSEVKKEKVMETVTSKEDVKAEVIEPVIEPKAELVQEVSSKPVVAAVTTAIVKETADSVYAGLYGEDDRSMQGLARKSLLTAMIWLISDKYNCTPDDITQEMVMIFTKKLSVRSFEKQIAKNINAGPAGMIYSMNAKNIKELLIKELMFMGPRMITDGILTLGGFKG